MRFSGGTCCYDKIWCIKTIFEYEHFRYVGESGLLYADEGISTFVKLYKFNWLTYGLQEFNVLKYNSAWNNCCGCRGCSDICHGVEKEKFIWVKNQDRGSWLSFWSDSQSEK